MFRPLVSRSFVLLFALVLTPALGHAAPQELINGRSQQLEGSIGFTFWVKQGQMLSNTPGEYLVLDGAAQQNLLKGAVIVAPPGFKVQQVELTIREEETSSSSRIGRTEYTSKYKQHVIR